MAVTERPILMSGPMVRAILEGRKTQTRRLAKVTSEWCKDGFISPLAGHTPRRIAEHAAYCPYGQPGDRLWVRETFCDDWASGIYYRADGDLPIEMFDAGCKWRPSIFMPRKHCRLVLELTAVRVERLQEISQQDVFREGLHNAQQKEIERAAGKLLASFECYERLWDSLNAKRAPWASNPWVWVLEFRRT